MHYTLQLERIWQKWFSTLEKKIQKMLIPQLLPFYVVKITQKSKQNEPGQNAQDSLVFSKLRYCALPFYFFEDIFVKVVNISDFPQSLGTSVCYFTRFF